MASKTSTIGDRIRDVRTRNEWTQEKVGEWCGLSPSHIAQFEAGRDPNAKNLKRLALGLRVTSDWLLGIGE